MVQVAWIIISQSYFRNIEVRSLHDHGAWSQCHNSFRAAVNGSSRNRPSTVCLYKTLRSGVQCAPDVFVKFHARRHNCLTWVDSLLALRTEPWVSIPELKLCIVIDEAFTIWTSGSATRISKNCYKWYYFPLDCEWAYISGFVPMLFIDRVEFFPCKTSGR